jgi:hypothetical protein
MEDLILLSLALISGWIIMAGAGELWFKIFTAKWGKDVDANERVIALCICRAISILPIALGLWSLEYMQGLGKNISILLAPLLISCLWIYYINWHKASREEKRTRILFESFFVLSVFYVMWLFWGNSDLDHFVDKGGDLLNTVTMASGETLPPTHPWLPPFKAEEYYRGQWYVGGLLARLCNLSPGHTYYSSYMLCVGWITYAILACGWIITKQKLLPTIVVLLTITLGGHFGYIVAQMTHKETPHPMVGGNLVGRVLTTQEYSKNNLGNKLGLAISENLEAASKHTKPYSPINGIVCEPYAYSIFLGDWHSSFGSYLVLSLLVAAIAGFMVSRAPPNAYLNCLLLALILPSSFVFNTWAVPIVFISVATTLILGAAIKQKGYRYLMATLLFGIIATALLASQLSYILSSKEYGKLASFKLIASAESATFTPYLGWIFYAGAASLWALLCGLTAISNIKPKSWAFYFLSFSLAITLSTIAIHLLRLGIETMYPDSRLHYGVPLTPAILIFIPTLYLTMLAFGKIKGLKFTPINWLTLVGIVVFTTMYALIETVFIDDYLPIPWERYNSSNKWMPTTLFVVTALLSPIVLTARSNNLKGIGYILAALLIIPTGYSIIKHKQTGNSDFSGTRWIKDSSVKPIYENLLKLPKGVVLEYQHKNLDFATPSGIMPLHTGHDSFIGWVYGHLSVWYPSLKVIENRRNESIKFYEGRLPNPDQWAKENGIDYIVWSMSLPKKHLVGSLYKPFNPPSDQEMDWAWELNNQTMSREYTWFETKPKPLREGIWVLKSKTNEKDGYNLE